MFITEWFQKRKKKFHRELYIKGYDTAAGIMLRHEKTPVAMSNLLDYDNWSFFDEGWHDAIEYLVARGIVKDDRP